MAEIDDKLCERIRVILMGKRGIEEKKMFGGRCFLRHGNMVCGTSSKGRLVARIGPDNYEKAMKQKHVTEMNITGKPLKGMVFILPEGIKRKDALKKWVEMSLLFAKSLPKK